MQSFSPSSNQSSGVFKLEKSLAEAQNRMNKLNQNPIIYSTPIPKNNVSIPSDPSSLSSSLDRNHDQVNEYVSIKFQNQREITIQLQTQINSFISFINAQCSQNFNTLDDCAKFISQYFKNANQMKQVQDLYISEKVENESLHSQVKTLKNDYKNEHKKTKKLMELLKQLREYTKQQDDQITCQASEINELKLKLSQQNSTNVQFPMKNISIETNFPLNNFEKILETQSKEIKELSEQRNLLLKNYKALDKLFNSNLISLINSEEMKQKEINENKRKTPTKNYSYCFTQTDETVNNNYNNKQQNPSKAKNHQNDINSQIRQNHCEEVLSTVFSILQSIAISTPSKSGQREDLISEIARINRYLDDHSIQIKRPDIHFLNMINDEQIKNSPLYETFVCVVNILNIIINIENSKPKKVLVEDSELKLANVELKTELSRLQNQLCEILQCKTPQIINKVSSMVKNEKKLRKDFKETQNQAKILNEETRKLEQDIISHRNVQLKDKKKFTQIATKMVDEITEMIQKQSEKYEDQISDLGKRLDEAKLNIFKLKEKTQQESLNYKKIIADKNKLIKQKSEEIQKYSRMREIELREKNDLISRLNHKIETLQTKYSDEKTQNRDFQDELNLLNQERDSVFLVLNTKNKELAQQIEKLREDKQNEIENLTQTLKDKVEQIESSNEKFVRENSKEKAANQTLKMKLEESERQNKLEKEHFEAKVASLSIKAQSSIEEFKERFISILNKIGGKLNLQLRSNNQEDLFENKLEILIPQIYHKIDNLSENEIILKDAIQARKRLNIVPSESLVDIIAKYENDIFSQQDKNSKQAEMNELNLSKLNQKIELSEDLTKKVNEWRSWASSILKYIKDNFDPNLPDLLARKEIEEILWIALREKASLQRIELLKRQKFIIKNYAEFLEPVSKWNSKVRSIRPLALVAIFSKRLMKMSGTLPLQMAIRDQNY